MHKFLQRVAYAALFALASQGFAEAACIMSVDWAKEPAGRGGKPERVSLVNLDQMVYAVPYVGYEQTTYQVVFPSNYFVITETEYMRMRQRLGACSNEVTLR